MKKVIRCAGPVIALGLATASLVAAPASATTFCVPTFRADCPNSGGNKAEADVEKAMSTEAADGKADQILIAPGTYTETNAFEPAGGDGGTFEPTGSDKLTIAGAGPGATVLTSGQTGNAYILNLDFNNTREITLRDLTIRAPATLPDGGGAAVQAHGDHFENVDLESRNPGTDGISMIGGGSFRDPHTFRVWAIDPAGNKDPTPAKRRFRVPHRD